MIALMQLEAKAWRRYREVLENKDADRRQRDAYLRLAQGISREVQNMGRSTMDTRRKKAR